MIDKKDLKVGDKVAGIYREGYAGSGNVVPMVIKKMGTIYMLAKPIWASPIKFVYLIMLENLNLISL